jgi:hypothetical protein
MSSPLKHTPLLFTLVRDEDKTGVSGTDTVADGVRWPDGHVALHWRTQYTSTAVYDSMETLRHIHGHGGKTRVVWAGTWNDAEKHPFGRGAFHCALDDNENAPFASVGGLPARAGGMVAPDYIEEKDRDEYVAGYCDQAHAMYGPDWRTFSLSWVPVLSITSGPGEDDDAD